MRRNKKVLATVACLAAFTLCAARLGFLGPRPASADVLIPGPPDSVFFAREAEEYAREHRSNRVVLIRDTTVSPSEFDLHSSQAAADLPADASDRLTLSTSSPFLYFADPFRPPTPAEREAMDARDGTKGLKRVEPGPGLRRGTWDLELSGSHMAPIRYLRDHITAGSVAAGYFIADNFSVNAAVVGYSIDQPRNYALAVGLDLYARVYFLTLDRFALYADAGAGVVLADKRVPKGGAEFSFTPRAGVGLSYRVEDNVYLMGGARYWHLSNAGYHGSYRNPGYDSVQYYGGVMFAF